VDFDIRFESQSLSRAVEGGRGEEGEGKGRVSKNRETGRAAYREKGFSSVLQIHFGDTFGISVRRFATVQCSGGKRDDDEEREVRTHDFIWSLVAKELGHRLTILWMCVATVSYLERRGGQRSLG
jgi:hypothetical protein